MTSIFNFDAKEENKLSVTLWGTGSPKREFVFVDDVVDACLVILKEPLSSDILPINIGVGYDISIKLLAEKISLIIGYQGKIEWDKSMPDGAPSKLLDSGRVESLGWRAKVNLNDGIKQLYQWYLKNI